MLSTAYARDMPVSGTRTSYHHGTLRRELIAACLALIETDGIGAVSLRRVARAAGVSPGAPYHHFPDRAALLAAITAHGYEMLESQLRRALQDAPTATRGLGALVETYVAFARDYPAYLHVMLRPELSQPGRHPEAEAAAEAALQVLTGAVEDCQREGTAPPGDPGPLVAMIWALATGIVTLRLDGPLENRCAAMGTTPEELTARITALLEAMLRQDPAA
jgi:AcrR family transcriptional regulator